MEVIADFSMIEVRLIQSLWETKSVQFIANMLEKPFATVERKIQEMNRVHQVKLFQPKTFERKIKRKEVSWAQQQLQVKPAIKIADQSGKISVRLDDKTVVLVKAGTDVENYRKTYLKNKLSAFRKR